MIKIYGSNTRITSARPTRRKKIKNSRLNLRNGSTFGHPHDKHRYFDEYDKYFLNKEGPGPAKYTPNEFQKSEHVNTPKYKFTTAARFNPSKGKYPFFRRFGDNISHFRNSHTRKH